MQRAQNAELAHLLLDGKYSPEQAPPVDAVSGQQVSLCVGSEQRLDAGGRVYFLDHGKRTTAWADPRMEDDATDDPPLPTSTQDDLQLLLSGVLPDMAVGPADLRHALHKAVRHALQRAEAEAAEDSSSLTGVHHERRLLLQQQVHLSLLERMQGTHDTRSANSDLAHATSLCYAVFNVGRAAEPEPHLLSSLQKHAEVGSSAERLLETYTSGIFGPRMSHLLRVLDRLDTLGPACLRAAPSPASGRLPMESLVNSLEARLHALLEREATPREAWWLALQASPPALPPSRPPALPPSRPPALPPPQPRSPRSLTPQPLAPRPSPLAPHPSPLAPQTLLGLAEASGMARLLIGACRLLLSASPLTPLIPTAGRGGRWPPDRPPRHPALEGRPSPEAAAAPGIAYRVSRLQAAISAHHVNYASGIAARAPRTKSTQGAPTSASAAVAAAHAAHWAALLEERGPGGPGRAWRVSLGLPEAAMAEGMPAPPPRKGKVPPPPPELQTPMGPEASAVALLSSAAAMASPLEAWLLQPHPATQPPPRPDGALPPTLRGLHGLVPLSSRLCALPEWPEPWSWESSPNPSPSNSRIDPKHDPRRHGQGSSWAFRGISLYGGVQVMLRPASPNPNPQP